MPTSGAAAGHTDPMARALTEPDGETPDQVVAERLRSRRRLAKPEPEGGAGAARAERNRARRDTIADARLVAEAAKDISPPDTYRRDGDQPVVLGVDWPPGRHHRLAEERHDAGEPGAGDPLERR